MGKIVPKKKEIKKTTAIEVEKPKVEIKKKVAKQKNKKPKTIGDQIFKDGQKSKTIPNKSEMFKTFSKSIQSQLPAELPKNMTKGQKQRATKKNKVMKRKLFDKFIDEKKQKSSNSFLLNALKDDLNKMTTEGQHVEQSKAQTQHMRNKQLVQDQTLMKQVLNVQQFQQNPLATIKLHLENTFKQQGK